MAEPESQTTTALNEWKETVRAIFDMLVLSSAPTSELERRIFDHIETRHHAYFCEGKTMAEWKGEAL